MMEEALTLGAPSTATVIALYVLLKTLMIPKLNTVCIRTKRMEIAQTVLIDIAQEDHPKQDIRGRILDEIDMKGIPVHDSPISLK